MICPIWQVQKWNANQNMVPSSAVLFLSKNFEGQSRWYVKCKQDKSQAMVFKAQSVLECYLPLVRSSTWPSTTYIPPPTSSRSYSKWTGAMWQDARRRSFAIMQIWTWTGLCNPDEVREPLWSPLPTSLPCIHQVTLHSPPTRISDIF